MSAFEKGKPGDMTIDQAIESMRPLAEHLAERIDHARRDPVWGGLLLSMELNAMQQRSQKRIEQIKQNG